LEVDDILLLKDVFKVAEGVLFEVSGIAAVVEVGFGEEDVVDKSLTKFAVLTFFAQVMGSYEIYKFGLESKYDFLFFDVVLDILQLLHEIFSHPIILKFRFSVCLKAGNFLLH
jgi:hypothetical protein